MSATRTPPDFRRILSAVPGCFLAVAKDLAVLAASDECLGLFGLARDVALDRPLAEVLAGVPGAAALCASAERVLAARTPEAITVPSGEDSPLRVNSAPVFDDDGAVAYVVQSFQKAPAAAVPAAAYDRYRELFDTAPDATVVVGADGRIELVNAQTERLFGYARAELLGAPLATLIPERFRAAHKGHEARFLAAAGQRPMGSNLELFGRRKDGTELPIEVSLSPLRFGEAMTVSAAIRDISERRRMEAATKLLADRLASAVESIQDAFALFDGGDRLVLCNSVYRRLIGDACPGPIVGRPYEEILRAWIHEVDFPDEAARTRFLQGRLARRLQEQTATFDLRLRDGRNLRVIDRRTAEGGIVKTIWDLTDDERRAEELRLARAAAEAGSAAKSDFLSSMSHELRTPLNAILGFAQLLQRDKKEPLSARHRERIEQILKGGEHLLRLIDDILDLSRIEAGGISISTEPVSVNDVLSEVQRTLGPIAARQQIRVELDSVPPQLPMVSADRTRFLQILMNFGSNAIKYNRPAGRVTFRVSTPRPDFVRIAVHDTGMGIPADKQDKLFQPFQRVGQEMGPIEGTGIGLVITKRLAQLMGGEVGFRSVEGEGSEFRVDLPAHASHALESAASAIQGADPGRLAPDVMRVVLYVEDNPANVVFMRDLVGTFENIELVTAATAERGIELARARHIDVVIMDINLPGMSGIDALHALRALPETREIPVIALTAAASERDRQRGAQAGFFRYLTKPVKVDELITALEEVLGTAH